MSCLQESDDSDYGSDFTPDEEQLLNELLNQVVGHATDETSATSPSTPILTSTPTPVAEITTPKSPERLELESLSPAALAALVADIEDVVEEPSVRLPKVLGREGPRSPWRLQQARTAQRRRWDQNYTGSSPYVVNGNRPRSSGKLVASLHLDSDLFSPTVAFDLEP